MPQGEFEGVAMPSSVHERLTDIDRRLGELRGYL